jgi:hypothetical protein
LALIAGLLFTGCQTNNIVNENVSITLDNTACSAPCWNGVIPGKTTREELISSFAATFPRPNKVFYKNGIDYDETILLAYDFWDKEMKFNEKELWFDIQDNIVTLITLDGFEMGLGQMIQEMGNPESVFSFGEAESVGFVANYPSKGISVFFRYAFGQLIFSNPKEKANINSDSQTSYWFYYDPAYFSRFLEIQYNLSLEQQKQFLYPWNGYGEIETKYPLVSRSW